jgi:hypothetical protein
MTDKRVFVDSLSDLPVRLQRTLAGAHGEAAFWVGLRTAYQPNSTIPRLWLLLFKEFLVLASTHATRGVWLTLRRADVDSLDIESRGHRQYVIRVRTVESYENILALPTASEISADEIKQFRTLGSSYFR